MLQAPTPAAGEITHLLHRVSSGDPSADNELLSRVYGELRRVARNYLRKERASHTLQPTALVHEAYLRLTLSEMPPLQDRVHFFAVAALAMRRILVDYARSRCAAKRAVGLHVPLAFAQSMSSMPEQFFPPLDEALGRLALINPRAAKIVELRFFGGLTEDEIASFLNLCSRTVKRDWAFARAWLHGELGA